MVASPIRVSARSVCLRPGSHDLPYRTLTGPACRIGPIGGPRPQEVHMRKLTLAAAALALAATVAPAQAAKHTPGACVTHTDAYVVFGKLATPGALTENSDGTY